MFVDEFPIENEAIIEMNKELTKCEFKPTKEKSRVDIQYEAFCKSMEYANKQRIGFTKSTRNRSSLMSIPRATRQDAEYMLATRLNNLRNSFNDEELDELELKCMMYINNVVNYIYAMALVKINLGGVE